MKLRISWLIYQSTSKKFMENIAVIQLNAIFKNQMLTWQIKSMVDWRFLDVDVFHVIKLCEHVIMQSNFKTKEYSIWFYMQFDSFEFLKMLRDHFLLSHMSRQSIILYLRRFALSNIKHYVLARHRHTKRFWNERIWN